MCVLGVCSGSEERIPEFFYVVCGHLIYRILNDRHPHMVASSCELLGGSSYSFRFVDLFCFRLVEFIAMVLIGLVGWLLCPLCLYFAWSSVQREATQ